VPGPILEFGDYRLDCERFELSRAGRVLKLERKPMELLALLAAREGDLVTRTEIAQHLWGSEVFVDTEHGINTAIRKVRQALRDDPDHPRFVQTVTGRGYRFVGPVATIQSATIQSISALGSAPPASPTEISSPEPSGASAPPADPPVARSRLWLILGSLAALLLVVITITLLLREHTTHAATPPIHSLAVLPLNNLSGDPKQDYFADGMTDELTTMLAKDSTLRVISRTSAEQFRDPHRPLPAIAASLGVDGIVEGSISRADGNVHMTVQLIHAPSDTHIWADSYDRDASDVAALPDVVATAIANRLHSALPLHAAARYVSPEAHDAYLRGHYLWIVGRNDEAGKYFRRAVQIQPDYAPGWAGLSEYYAVGALHGDLDPLEALPQAEAAAHKAVDLDDSLPQAHSVLAAAIFFNRWDGDEALKEITRATELNPQNFDGYHLHAKILCALGRNEEAIAVQKQATAENPIEHPGAMAEIYLCARQYDSAIHDGQLRLEDFPDAPDVLSYLADSYHWKGMDKEAVEMLAREFTAVHSPKLADCIHRAFSSGGYNAVVRCELANLKKKEQSQPVSTMGIARLQAMLGEQDKTLALLEQALNERDPLLLWIQTDPAFDFLHKDKRYRAVVQKIGLPPAS
jgi:TolB-like protein/DNA-binding winged helix-turn-helix (wHTH) protein